MVNYKKLIAILTISLIILFSIIFYFILTKDICGDGTPFDSCSKNKPYFCEKGVLIEKASLCQCPKDFEAQENICTSKYQKRPKQISLNYILNKKIGTLNFITYEAFVNYTQAYPKFISYSNGNIPSRKDFKIRNINEPLQREFLLPLVIKIQNLAQSKKKQAEIAISIVQNIPYGNSNQTLSIGKQNINSSRYPYEVLYDMHGVCSEKSELLVFLLKEIGYGVSIFYYPEENHEAVGIKCSGLKDYKDTGYCFIETTGILNGEIKNLSNPEVIPISEGDSFNWFF